MVHRNHAWRGGLTATFIEQFWHSALGSSIGALAKKSETTLEKPNEKWAPSSPLPEKVPPKESDMPDKIGTSI